MPGVRRFSSRREHLADTFLRSRLRNARQYLRVAGYFRSSLLELVREELTTVPDIRVVCNSNLDPRDCQVARRALHAALLARWREGESAATAAFFHRERYRLLRDLLTSGRARIRVLPASACFVHGKAGLITLADGSRTAFLGSVNETREAFEQNYELIWEDDSPEAVQWVEEEFEALWHHPLAVDLPEVIIAETGRLAERVEVRLGNLAPRDLPAATFVEAPICRGGEQLQPWQKAFVVEFLQHRERYGKARLLLADEVGLGKTLSLGASAVLSALLDDGPVLILCPANLTLQWQAELADRLGVPSMVWSSQGKHWIDWQGHEIRVNAPEDILRCPARIGIVSTGLVFRKTAEREALLSGQYGTVVLDEAHRARQRNVRQAGRDAPNNLLDFLRHIARKTRHLLLGTATPIQTEIREVWDLMDALGQNAEFVLGSRYSSWRDCARAAPILRGETVPGQYADLWEWVRDPIPHPDEDLWFSMLRNLLELPDTTYVATSSVSSLPPAVIQLLDDARASGFLASNNPFTRHIVLRRRSVLEKEGLLETIGLTIHPRPDAPPGAYRHVSFDGIGLLTSPSFKVAYEAVEEFTRLLHQRVRGGGFMKAIMLQRLCSSLEAGRRTARQLLEDPAAPEAAEALPLDGELAADFALDLDMEADLDIDIDDEIADITAGLRALRPLTPEERECLANVLRELSREEIRDPKLDAVYTFLVEGPADEKPWLEYGCIVFSQYFDTARYMAEQVAARLPGEPVALYAGASKSLLYRGTEPPSRVEREEIKTAVRQRAIRLVFATDAACEGLNLQTLGTLINVDLPWNPARLEQRIGRVRRIGQARPRVSVLNLTYHDTQDEKIYEALSRRLKERFELFGSVPDILEAEWISDLHEFEQMLDRYIHLRDQAQTPFSLRYEQRLLQNPNEHLWEKCERVLSRRDILERLNRPWK